jgi:oxygen-independent coproporphyrinogen-3 oxidase
MMEFMSKVEFPWRNPPRSAYIHVPFCARRCGYCSFTLVAGRDDLIEPYLDALECELSVLERPHEVDTLFIGGGTPTQLNGSDLRRLLTLVLNWHPLACGHEFTVEANPSDLDLESIALFAESGVTRISLGAQSFRATKLRTLERDHSAQDIERSVQLARSHGMDVGIDLIFAAPGESLSEWASDLDRAIELDPDHVSTYSLTYERGTQFWNRRRHGELNVADEELERAMYELAIDRLNSVGFEHYEVSNFARPNKRCRHNETYWMGRAYFGAGPGAARYVDGVRSMNHRSTTNYIKWVLAGRSPVAESEELSSVNRALELLVFGLRRMDGVDRSRFQRQTGIILDSLVGAVLHELSLMGLIDDDGECVRLSRDGLLLSDSIFGRLLSGSIPLKNL